MWKPALLLITLLVSGCDEAKPPPKPVTAAEVGRKVESAATAVADYTAGWQQTLLRETRQGLRALAPHLAPVRAHLRPAGTVWSWSHAAARRYWAGLQHVWLDLREHGGRTWVAFTAAAERDRDRLRRAVASRLSADVDDA